jgi:hypothetical protein
MNLIKKASLVVLSLQIFSSLAVAEPAQPPANEIPTMTYAEFNRVSDNRVPELIYRSEERHPGMVFYDRYLDICREFIGKLQVAQQQAMYLINRGSAHQANSVLYSTVKEITNEIIQYPTVPPHSLDAMVQSWRILDTLNRVMELGLEETSLLPGVPVNSVPRGPRTSGYVVRSPKKVSADDLNRKLDPRPNTNGTPSQAEKAFFNIAIDLIELVGWAYDNLDQNYYIPWYNNCGPRWRCAGSDLQMGYAYYDYVNELALEILQSVYDHTDKLDTRSSLMISSTAFGSAADLLSKYEYAHFLQCFIADLDYFQRWTRAMAGQLLIEEAGVKYYHPSWELSPNEKRAITNGLLDSSISTLKTQTSGNPICWNHHWRIRPPYESFYSSRRAPQHLEQMQNHKTKTHVKTKTTTRTTIEKKEETESVHNSKRAQFPVYEIQDRKNRDQ